MPATRSCMAMNRRPWSTCNQVLATRDPWLRLRTGSLEKRSLSRSATTDSPPSGVEASPARVSESPSAWLNLIADLHELPAPGGAGRDPADVNRHTRTVGWEGWPSSCSGEVYTTQAS